MKENHFAYKIGKNASGLVCTHFEIKKDKMLDLLKEVQKLNDKSLYWIFKQLDNQPEEPLCIIDCSHRRIYYHYSGDVENIDDTIKKLSS